MQLPLCADGHVVSVYWVNISRSIVERCHRDAQTRHVPLYVLQAADTRTLYRNADYNSKVTHALLTVHNVNDTGKLPGILLVHVGMIVRLSDRGMPEIGAREGEAWNSSEGRVARVRPGTPRAMRENDFHFSFHNAFPRVSGSNSRITSARRCHNSLG